ncbi:MAG TPA: phosphatidate cytidylyltransferase [Capsulimonadaceae bacterium]|jgi:phosphatidate cytidylyltransferase
MPFDKLLVWAFGGTCTLLAIATLIATALSARARSDEAQATVRNLRARIGAWWLIVFVFAAALATGKAGAAVLFALVSFAAFSEFATLLKTSRYDHRALVTAFFIIAPLQYVFVYSGLYGMFTILIPVYAFLYVPMSLVLRGNTERFLERVATIQWGLMICIYCISYAPALLMLNLRGSVDGGAKLLLFLVFVVQLSDVLQYVCGKLLGKRPLAPSISPHKTWEGFIGGVVLASLAGAALWWLTPYTPLAAFAVSLGICLAGVVGGLTMSAVKRDRGVKDFGSILPGHGGMLDRIDSLCFAAPILFHVTRYFFGG